MHSERHSNLIRFFYLLKAAQIYLSPKFIDLNLLLLLLQLVSKSGVDIWGSTFQHLYIGEMWRFI